jgi:hypothetical protein
MCHGHVDLRTVEREVQERLRAVKPSLSAVRQDDEVCPPGLIGGLPGLLARLRPLLAPLRRAARA